MANAKIEGFGKELFEQFIEEVGYDMQSGAWQYDC